MSNVSANYFIYSAAEGKDNVGIWWLYHKEQQEQQQRPIGQPVRLKADLVEWVATPPITGGGTRLGVGPYRHTYELEGEVFATNESSSQEWYLRPGNGKDLYLIGKDPETKYVWTAVEPGQPIKIEPFKVGDWKQVFKIVPALRDE